MTTAAYAPIKKNKPIKRRFSTKSRRKQQPKRNPIDYATANAYTSPNPSGKSPGRPRSACILCIEKKVHCSVYPRTTSCKR